MSNPDPKPTAPPPMGFVVPPADPNQHGFVNPIAGREPQPPPYNHGAPYSSYPGSPGFQPAIPVNPGHSYPPSSGDPSYPGSPGFNTSGDPLITDFKPGYPPSQPGQPLGGYVPKDNIPLADEEGSLKGFGFTDKTIRRQFIKKVYAILMFQLLVTFSFVALCLFHDGIRVGVQRNPSLLWVAFGVTIVTIIPMVCCDSVRRKFPMNFIFLSLFTLAQGFLLGVVATVYEVDSVLVAVGITVVVCLTLTLFAFQTKYDFTTKGGVLLVLLVVLMIMGFIMPFYPGDKLRVVYGSFGALVFSFYLIYDTQLIMGGKHKVTISPEEYIFAALNIYLDVINLFMYILMIFGQRK